MHKKNIKNQFGFSAVEGLLILVILGMLGFTGWYVWHVKQNTKKISNETVKQSQPVLPAHGPTYTLSGDKQEVYYNNPAARLFLIYPASWVHLDTTDKLCGNAFARDLEIGPDAKSIVKCGGDSMVSQVSISSRPGKITNFDGFAEFTDNKHKGWINVIKSTVTIDGVKGTFYCGTAKGQNDDMIGAFPDGTEVYQDFFVKNNITYSAIYTQYPKSSKEGPTQNQDAAFNKILGSLKFD